MNLAGGKFVHSANDPDLAIIKHFAQDGTAFVDLLHDQTNVGLGYLVNKLKVF